MEREFDPVIDAAQLQGGLTYLLQAQRPMLVAFDHDNDDPDTLARYAAALMIEVGEFSNTIPWKVWPSRSYDPDMTAMRAQIAEEFADVLHYVGTWVNLLRHFELSPEDLTVAFVEKHRENQRRLARREERQ